MTVFHSDHLFHLLKLSGQPYRGQKTLITVNIFPAIFSGDFSQSTGAKNRSTCLPCATFLRRPESHAPAREGAWPTFWCRAFTSRLVRRRLALQSLRQSSPNPASPFFWHFSLLRRQLPSLAETCVCLGKASSSSPVTFLICLDPNIPGSSSTAVIQPSFRALFDPNVIQSQVK